MLTNTHQHLIRHFLALEARKESQDPFPQTFTLSPQEEDSTHCFQLGHLIHVRLEIPLGSHVTGALLGDLQVQSLQQPPDIPAEGFLFCPPVLTRLKEAVSRSVSVRLRRRRVVHTVRRDVLVPSVQRGEI